MAQLITSNKSNWLQLKGEIAAPNGSNCLGSKVAQAPEAETLPVEVSDWSEIVVELQII